MIVMTIMMVSDPGGGLGLLRHQNITAKKMWNEKKWGTKENILLEFVIQTTKTAHISLVTFSLKLSLVFLNIFNSHLEKIWTFEGTVTQ